jgi:hypothetical protein
MTTDIFNMGVWMVALKNNQKTKLVQEKSNHYMELDFNISNYLHHNFLNSHVYVDTSHNVIFGDLQ